MVAVTFLYFGFSRPWTGQQKKGESNGNLSGSMYRGTIYVPLGISRSLDLSPGRMLAMQ